MTLRDVDAASSVSMTRSGSPARTASRSCSDHRRAAGRSRCRGPGPRGAPRRRARARGGAPARTGWPAPPRARRARAGRSSAIDSDWRSGSSGSSATRPLQPGLAIHGPGASRPAITVITEPGRRGRNTSRSHVSSRPKPLVGVQRQHRAPPSVAHLLGHLRQLAGAGSPTPAPAPIAPIQPSAVGSTSRQSRRIVRTSSSTSARAACSRPDLPMPPGPVHEQDQRTRSVAEAIASSIRPSSSSRPRNPPGSLRSDDLDDRCGSPAPPSLVLERALLPVQRTPFPVGRHPRATSPVTAGGTAMLAHRDARARRTPAADRPRSLRGAVRPAAHAGPARRGRAARPAAGRGGHRLPRRERARALGHRHRRRADRPPRRHGGAQGAADAGRAGGGGARPRHARGARGPRRAARRLRALPARGGVARRAGAQPHRARATGACRSRAPRRPRRRRRTPRAAAGGDGADAHRAARAVALATSPAGASACPPRSPACRRRSAGPAR